MRYCWIERCCLFPTWRRIGDTNATLLDWLASRASLAYPSLSNWILYRMMCRLQTIWDLDAGASLSGPSIYVSPSKRSLNSRMPNIWSSTRWLRCWKRNFDRHGKEITGSGMEGLELNSRNTLEKRSLWRHQGHLELSITKYMTSLVGRS